MADDAPAKVLHDGVCALVKSVGYFVAFKSVIS